MKGRCSSLERLTLDLSHKLQETPCDLFEAAPRLSDVYVRIYTSSSNLVLPFHQIRRYEESAWDSSSIDIALPNVEEARINGFGAVELAISLAANSGKNRIKSLVLSTPRARPTGSTPLGSKRLSELFNPTPFLENLEIESSLLYDLNRALQDTSSLPRLRKLRIDGLPTADPHLTNALKSITSLAASRCEGPGDSRTKLIDELFIAVEPYRCIDIQRELENWKGHGKECDRLLELDMRLIDLLPELGGNSISRSRETDARKAQLSDLFKELQVLQELDDPRNLAWKEQFSSLFQNITYLYHMYSTLPSSSFPFSSRTGEILDAWLPNLINAVGTMNWIITEQGIIYLRKDDARRLDQTMIDANYGYIFHRHKGLGQE